MEVSNRKGIANQTGPESCVVHHKVRDNSLTGNRTLKLPTEQRLSLNKSNPYENETDNTVKPQSVVSAEN